MTNYVQAQHANYLDIVGRMLRSSPGARNVGHMTTVTDLDLTFDLADRLRKARELNGWDIGEMAERLGVSRGSVSGWERRRHYPHHKNLRDYAEVTGVPLSWLVTREYQTDRSPYLRLVAA